MIGQQGGGDDLMRAKVELWRTSTAVCQSPYCTAVDELALVLRVDDEFFQFDFIWPERARWSRSRRYVTIDVGIRRPNGRGATTTA